MSRSTRPYVLFLGLLGTLGTLQFLLSSSQRTSMQLQQESGFQKLALISDDATKDMIQEFKPDTVLDAEACKDRSLEVLVNKRIQRDYCVRHFDKDKEVPGYQKANLKGFSGQDLPIYGYEENDIVSELVKKEGKWENRVFEEIVKAMKKAEHLYQVSSPSDLHFLDIGGNIGSVTLYVAGEGYKTIVFEPMLSNEIAIRNTLCANDLTERVTYFPRGLGTNNTVCEIWSPGINQGNGFVICPGTVRNEPDIHFRGRVEVITLDEALYCEADNNIMRFGVAKIDVEGLEYAVLSGGKKFFSTSKIPFIVYESVVMPRDQRKAFLEFFMGFGYTMSCHGFFHRHQDIYDSSILNCANIFLSLKSK